VYWVQKSNAERTVNQKNQLGRPFCLACGKKWPTNRRQSLTIRGLCLDGRLLKEW